MSSRRLLRVGSSAVLVAWGTALLTRPAQVSAALAGRPVPPTAVVRLLGARQLVQQVVVLAVPTRTVAGWASSVDLLHAASMLAAAGLAPRYRRAELISGAVAVAAALATRAGTASSDVTGSPRAGC